MLKAQMEAQLKEAHEIIGKIIKNHRSEQTNICYHCGAFGGEQHAESCQVWVLINWRKANHDLGLFGAERQDLSTPHPRQTRQYGSLDL